MSNTIENLRKIEKWKTSGVCTVHIAGKTNSFQNFKFGFYPPIMWKNKIEV